MTAPSAASSGWTKWSKPAEKEDETDGKVDILAFYLAAKL